VKSKKINVDLEDVSVETALDLILEDAGAGIVRLSWMIDGGVIRVCTATKLSYEFYPLLYDVRDLVSLTE
jgi:hypothetical protein